VAEAEGNVCGAARDQTIGWIGHLWIEALLDRLGQLVEDPGDDGHEDRVTVWEVSIDRWGGDADLPGDRAQRHSLARARPIDKSDRSGDNVFRQPSPLAAGVALPLSSR
jgi:hypothetical protein